MKLFSPDKVRFLFPSITFLFLGHLGKAERPTQWILMVYCNFKHSLFSHRNRLLCHFNQYATISVWSEPHPHWETSSHYTELSICSSDKHHTPPASQYAADSTAVPDVGKERQEENRLNRKLNMLQIVLTSPWHPQKPEKDWGEYWTTFTSLFQTILHFTAAMPWIPLLQA